MAIVNFSVPDDIKDRFNQTFSKTNKSAVVARLMQEAIEREQRKAARNLAIERIKANFAQRQTVSADEYDKAMEASRC